MGQGADQSRRGAVMGFGNAGASFKKNSGSSFSRASSCCSPGSAVGAGSRGVRALRQSSSNSRHWRNGVPIPSNSSSSSSPVCSNTPSPFNSSNGETHTAGGGNSSGAWPAYQVPLARVAAFVRQAGLVPRLFTKYVTQLQRMAEDAEKGSSSRLAGRVPVMPSLHASLGPRLSQGSGYKLQQKGASHRRRR